MIYFKKHFVLFAEAWYSVERIANRADIVHFYSVLSPPAKAVATEATTIWIDLASPESTLLQGMRKNTRHEIRRASEDDLKYTFLNQPGSEDITAFLEFFGSNKVANDSDADTGRWIRNHQNAGSVVLSRISSSEGGELVWHAFYVDGIHCRLKYSVSRSRNTDGITRNLIGKAHRLQHWEDMKHFKNLGFKVYDLGGWSHNTTDGKLLHINQFKESFGGRIVNLHHCTLVRTLKGRCYFWLAKFLKRVLGLGLVRHITALKLATSVQVRCK